MLQSAQLLQNRYRLDRPLSQAAGRETWLATDTQTQEQVVVKLLAFSDAVQWNRVRLFEREAAILRQLQHDRIPQYRDQFCLDDRLLWFGLVHDYIPGRSLKEELSDRGKFSEDDVRAIAISVLEVLDYLHSLNPPVLHRDIKPSNLICSADNQIYLIDFGTVQDRIAKEGATFTVVGTYGYVPLEQLGGRTIPASDLYALGATLMHLLTGIAPADLPLQDSRSLVSLDASPALRRWLLRMIEPNFDRRFTSAKLALAALRSTQKTQNIQHKFVNQRIKIQKAPHRFRLELPMSYQVIVLPLLIAGMIALIFTLPIHSLATATLWIYGIWLTALLGVLPLFIFWLLTLPDAIATQVKINPQQFEICWKLLGIPIHRVRGETAEIDRVYSTTNRVKSGQFGIGISAGIHEYRLSPTGLKLDAEDCRKLAAEIADWLGLIEEAYDAEN
ncbi:serine/threonine protein kinase [Microcoleus sp. FACHB-1515]|uniref:serine/threonine protein kinase n=1 Tax=Cyanophyceae TaxID=3028117 RepID=UPI00168A2D4C|nr:serine/threonine-protein kinase [Microcoleus sp. FACHB-1515]MBD2091997.1 serine/threonine protein kinase [Microcoleus sp. FACHB-1515]